MQKFPDFVLGALYLELCTWCFVLSVLYHELCTLVFCVSALYVKSTQEQSTKYKELSTKYKRVQKAPNLWIRLPVDHVE